MTPTATKTPPITYARRGRLIGCRGWCNPQDKKRHKSLKMPRRSVMSGMGVAGTAAPLVDEPESKLFSSLVRQWKDETLTLSSIEEIALHPAYQRIIGMGPAVVPWILRELEAEPDQWFWALRALTGENPVDTGARGRIAEMAQCWLSWARHRGIRW